MGYPSSLPPPPLGFEIFKSLYLSHFWPDQSFTHHIWNHTIDLDTCHITFMVFEHLDDFTSWKLFLSLWLCCWCSTLVIHGWTMNNSENAFNENQGSLSFKKKNCFINISNVYFDHFFMQGPVIKQIDWFWIMFTPTKCNCNGECGTSSLTGRQRRQPNWTLFYWEYGQKRNCTHHPLLWVTVPELK